MKKIQIIKTDEELKKVLVEISACLDQAGDLTNQLFYDIDNRNKKREVDPYQFKRIVLEVGHGDHPNGREEGAETVVLGEKITEWCLNVECANSCKKRLTELGYKQVDIAEEDDYLGAIGKKYSYADIFVSIHHNSSYSTEAQGAEVLVHEDLQRPLDRKLASIISRELSEELRIRDRGVKELTLGVLRGFIQNSAKNSAAVLTESFFISDESLKTHGVHVAWSKKGGVAIANGIHKFIQNEKT